jgi:regulator of protease activity HflC (stomatin/prohibitin superfamily)
MDLTSVALAFVLAILGYSVGSTKIINQGNEALVERLGKFHRKLNPGLNFIVPLLDTIVYEDTLRERVLDIQPQEVITKDSVPARIDAVVYWRILDLKLMYYAVDDLEQALDNLVITTLRSEIGRMNLLQTFSSRNEVNRALLHQLDDATASWGVKVIRVEVQDIKPADTVREAMEAEKAAQSKKQAAISEAEGRKQAAIAEAEGTVQAIEQISRALKGQHNSREVLNYLVAQRYVDASFKLGESNNSKVVFMDPKSLTEAVSDLIQTEQNTGSEGGGNGAIGPTDAPR